MHTERELLRVEMNRFLIHLYYMCKKKGDGGKVKSMSLNNIYTTPNLMIHYEMVY